MAVLVVGGSGFIGTTVVQLLANRDIETIALDLIHASSADDQKNWIRADILEMQSIERVFFEYNVDTIVHLVGLPAIDYCQKNPQFSFLLNVASVQNTLEAMRMADIPKIVFASSATVYGNCSNKPLKETDETQPTTVYGWHKLAAEQAINAYSETYGIKSATLRLFNVYGGDPKIGKEVVSILINRGLKGEPLILKGPEKFRDFVHIEDVAEAIAKSVTYKQQESVVLNIGTGTKTTLKQLALMVSSEFPRSKVVVEETPDDGTGLVANVSRAGAALDFSGRDPKKGIPDHIKKYAQKYSKVN